LFSLSLTFNESLKSCTAFAFAISSSDIALSAAAASALNAII